jgi:hypothetical protein
MIKASVLGTMVAAAIGFLGGLVVGQSLVSGGETALGAVLTGGVSIGATLALGPHRSRPILTWASLLIVLTTGRLIVSVGLCLLLYSAAQMPAAPLLVGMLLTLVIVLCTDTKLAAKRFSQATPTTVSTEPASSEPAPKA